LAGGKVSIASLYLCNCLYIKLRLASLAQVLGVGAAVRNYGMVVSFG